MNKKNINNEDDKLIRNLFNDFSPEEAPESIKQNAMNRVLHHWAEKPQTYQSFINKSNRWWILGAAAAVLAITFLVDASVIQQSFENLGLKSEYLDFSSVNKSLKQTFALASSIPSLVYFVGIGILFLLGIDKILTRLANL